MHFYNFNIGDYAKKTQHLTNEEDLAYRRLLDLYYDTEKPIANPSLNGGLAALSRRLRVDENALKNVLEEFFPDGKNKHADEKIAAYHAFIKKQSSNGKRGGRPKHNGTKPTDNPPITQALPTDNPPPSQPITNNQYPITKEESKALSGKPDDMPENTPTKKQNLTKEAQEVIEHLNLVTGSKFQSVDATIKLIVARIKEGATVAEIKRVIDVKAAAWINDPKMSEYLRPATLFNATNYANYSGQAETVAPKKERGFVC